MKNAKKIITKAATIICAATILLPVLYIMVNHLGLVDSLDFGAGAYYYADIPEFSKYVNSSAYTTQIPMWVFIALFLAWGFLMYRLWVWLEKRS